MDRHHEKLMAIIKVDQENIEAMMEAMDLGENPE
jgi:hypothetical protein